MSYMNTFFVFLFHVLYPIVRHVITNMALYQMKSHLINNYIEICSKYVYNVRRWVFSLDLV